MAEVIDEREYVGHSLGLIAVASEDAVCDLDGERAPRDDGLLEPDPSATAVVGVDEEGVPARAHDRQGERLDQAAVGHVGPDGAGLIGTSAEHAVTIDGRWQAFYVVALN